MANSNGNGIKGVAVQVALTAVLSALGAGVAAYAGVSWHLGSLKATQAAQGRTLQRHEYRMDRHGERLTALERRELQRAEEAARRPH